MDMRRQELTAALECIQSGTNCIRYRLPNLHIRRRRPDADMTPSPLPSPLSQVHLVGHSFGGLTLRVLQQYLQERRFHGGHKTSARWIRSITTVNAPLQGTLTVYALGAKRQEPDKIHFLSPGYFMGMGVCRPPRLYLSLSLSLLPTRSLSLYLSCSHSLPLSASLLVTLTSPSSLTLTVLTI